MPPPATGWPVAGLIGPGMEARLDPVVGTGAQFAVRPFWITALAALSAASVLRSMVVWALSQMFAIATVAQPVEPQN